MSSAERQQRRRQRNGASAEPAPASEQAPQAPEIYEEIVTIPNASVKVKIQPDGSGAITFILPSRRRAYQFLIDPDGRERLGQILATPTVSTYNLGDIPRG